MEKLSNSAFEEKNELSFEQKCDILQKTPVGLCFLGRQENAPGKN